MKKFYFLLLAFSFFTGVNAQIINFPDANFKDKLLAASPSYQVTMDVNGYWIKLDANNNGEIEVSEALLVKELRVGGQFTNPGYISSLVGIEYFTNLQVLNCSYNPQLTTVNFNTLVNLKQLYCSGTSITSLDASSLINLRELIFFINQLTSLNVSGLTNLTWLECSYNQLTSLNVSGLTSLTHLKVYNNRLSALNVSNLTNLQVLDCHSNLLTSLNTTGLSQIGILNCNFNQLITLDVTDISVGYIYMDCSNNNLTSLDMSSVGKINRIVCSNNPYLETLILKNGIYPDDTVEFSNCPNLRYVCQDEYYLYQIEGLINQYGYTNCTTSSYCFLNPGGDYYTMQGTNRFDFDANGCDASDFLFPYLKFNITGGVDSGNLIVNASGNYVIDLHSGAHTITPILENPSYFTISPPNVVVNYPTQASPFTQNFCVKANGSHPDLEVTLLPLNNVRPGFDAKYKIIYRNKGNTMQSGAVNLAFNDAVLDLDIVNPVVATQTVNNLSWNFADLLPFESREITLTFNVNSPMEIPAVHGGDILHFTTTITSAATDDMASDNTFAFNQVVLNSFDPNDKTCLEGATIAPSEVGKYVHYMIRFENNGTANAQNIVVKDMIDTAKFDVSSLVPIKGSHSFVTNITSGNKVEFIFENINLPFDDANNDGYVAFKIKTLPSLVNGDTFSNTANIYFDYNFPIVTNTATTNIQALSTQDFAFGNYFSLYPNPVKDILNIETKQTIEVSSINIYNQLGQLVLVVPNAQNIAKVDVSSLSSGNYFIKINSDKGTSNTKFIKK